MIGIVDVLEQSSACFAELRFDLGEEIPLDVGVFEDRFDDEVGIFEIGVALRAGDEAAGTPSAFCASGPLVSWLKLTSVMTPCTPRAMASVGHVAQGHGNLSLHVGGGDALAHRAGTEHADCRESCAASAPGGPVCFLLASCRKNTFSRARFTGEPNSSAKPSASIWQAVSRSTPAAPSITSKRRQWRGVVALGLALDVGARRGAEEGELRVADRDRLRPPRRDPARYCLRLLFARDQVNRRVEQLVRRHGDGQAHRFGSSGVDVLAAGDQLHRVGEADDPRRAGRAAPAGVQAELHFRKTEARLLAGHDAAIAPDGEFRPAADAETFNRRDGDEGQSSTTARTTRVRAARWRSPFPWAASMSATNSRRSAPAMKLPGLAERMTRPASPSFDST